MNILTYSVKSVLCAGVQVVKFVGCYHGHADSFLVQAGSGVATLGLPDSPGVPASSTGASTDPSTSLQRPAHPARQWWLATNVSGCQ